MKWTFFGAISETIGKLKLEREAVVDRQRAASYFMPEEKYLSNP